MNGLDFSISSPLGLGAAHSHANPFSAGRLGPTTLQRIAQGQEETKGGCVLQQGCQAQGMSQSGRRGDSDQPCFESHRQS